MTYKEYTEKYDALWASILVLPKPEAYEALKECAKLKKQFYKEHSECTSCHKVIDFCSKEERVCDECDQELDSDK